MREGVKREGEKEEGKKRRRCRDEKRGRRGTSEERESSYASTVH